MISVLDSAPLPANELLSGWGRGRGKVLRRRRVSRGMGRHFESGKNGQTVFGRNVDWERHGSERLI